MTSHVLPVISFRVYSIGIIGRLTRKVSRVLCAICFLILAAVTAQKYTHFVIWIIHVLSTFRCRKVPLQLVWHHIMPSSFSREMKGRLQSDDSRETRRRTMKGMKSQKEIWSWNTTHQTKRYIHSLKDRQESNKKVMRPGTDSCMKREGGSNTRVY